MNKVNVESINKSFGDVKVLSDVSLQIEDRSFTVLLGPSGCGKTTLLRIIAGLERQHTGEVFINEENITKVLPGDRNVAMVFQNYALYPHLTVYKNIEYGLKARKVKNPERREMVEQAISMVKLEDQSKKLPAKMSGGQRQRVALARAIVKRPEIFLMDEPLSNLDAKLRNHMRFELTELYHKLGATFLYVTHDQIEAMSMGTNIVIMDNGVIRQQGTPKSIYEDPDNLFVAGFIGSPAVNVLTLEDITFAIRPEHVSLNGSHDRHIRMDGEIISTEHLGYETVHTVKTATQPIVLKMPANWDNVDRCVTIHLEQEKLKVFDKEGNRIRGSRETADAISLLRQATYNQAEILKRAV